ncbi:A24 family peptidase [Noviherbaspirillum soli]|uniref:A24 family peptidase n=1 Tax=Noviherbaspirillum soli TaxID=1064518 RepID=UPI001889D7CB|nr:A24 family peptidase [Noviherbaspirillum soli]
MTAFLLLSGLLLIAVGHDFRHRRIPNSLVAAGMLAAMACAGAPDGIGLQLALAGMAFGLLSLLPLYALGGLGAGDVKLMAMVGAFIGPQAMPLTLLATLIAGGVLTLAVTLRRGTTRRMLHNVRDMLCSAWWRLACRQMPRIDPVPASAGRMPYALAIASGAWLQWMLADSSLAARLALY